MEVYAIISACKGYRQSRTDTLRAVAVLSQVQKSESRAESNEKAGCSPK